jgi:CheY-like chemotaxis protein
LITSFFNIDNIDLDFAPSLFSVYEGVQYNLTLILKKGTFYDNNSGEEFMERKYKLLIADDDQSIRSEYGDYFEKQGFIVELAQDGIEGLEKLRHDKEFDVALVDLKMPKMNGIEMIKQAHKAGNNAEMIILSHDKESEKADAIAAIKVGVKDWFEKSELHKPKFFARVKELAEGIPLEEVSRILSVIRD